MRRRRSLLALLAAGAAFASAAPAADAQTIQAPFDASYSLSSLGAPSGVPAPFGGLTFLAGDPNTLLIGGGANDPSGAIYRVGVTRDGGGRVTGYAGPATFYASAPNIDGGLAYAPNGTLLYTAFPNNTLGQIKPGSTGPDKIIELSSGVAPSVGTLAFVPTGQPGAGRFKIASYNGGGFYDVALTPDAAGTYDVSGATLGTTPGRGPEGIAYVPAGSPQFAAPSLLLSEYSTNTIGAYETNDVGDPLPDTRRQFISGLQGAQGALIDPQTGDYLFSTFGSGSDRVLVVKGFAQPRIESYAASGRPVYTTPEALSVAQPSRVTVKGTVSKFAASLMANPPTRGWAICGTPEAAPQIASPGVTNGRAGQDAAFLFSYPQLGNRCNPASARRLPVAQPLLQFSTDNGATWKTPQFDGTAPTSPTADHSYTYRVVGEGLPLKIRVNDSNYKDNYGQLDVDVEPLGPPSS